VVDIDKHDSPCGEHELRLRILEKSQEQIMMRLDKGDVLMHSIEKSVSRLQDDMTSHTTLMHNHIDLAFRNHEINEMKMHKDMLVHAIKATAGGLTFLVAALGSVVWWVVSHFLAVM